MTPSCPMVVTTAVDVVRAGMRGLVPPGACFVSLGQNCTTATYLQRVGKKDASYPFDWIFSSPHIIEDCISNNFEIFLDRDRYIYQDADCAGHSVYHARLFNHRNVIEPKHYDYYVRCVERFRVLYASDRPIVFVSTAIPEHSRRPGWAKGFVFAFPAPRNEDLLFEYGSLIERLSRRRGPTSLVLMEQRTNMACAQVQRIETRDNVLAIRFAARGASDGVRYLDPLDDALAQAVYAEITRPDML